MVTGNTKLGGMPLCSGGFWQPTKISMRRRGGKIDLNGTRWLNNCNPNFKNMDEGNVS